MKKALKMGAGVMLSAVITGAAMQSGAGSAQAGTYSHNSCDWYARSYSPPGQSYRDLHTAAITNDHQSPDPECEVVRLRYSTSTGTYDVQETPGSDPWTPMDIHVSTGNVGFNWSRHSVKAGGSWSSEVLNPL